MTKAFHPSAGHLSLTEEAISDENEAGKVSAGEDSESNG